MGTSDGYTRFLGIVPSGTEFRLNAITRKSVFSDYSNWKYLYDITVIGRTSMNLGSLNAYYLTDWVQNNPRFSKESVQELPSD